MLLEVLWVRAKGWSYSEGTDCVVFHRGSMSSCIPCFLCNIGFNQSQFPICKIEITILHFFFAFFLVYFDWMIFFLIRDCLLYASVTPNTTRPLSQLFPGSTRIVRNNNEHRRHGTFFSVRQWKKETFMVFLKFVSPDGFPTCFLLPDYGFL